LGDTDGALVSVTSAGLPMVMQLDFLSSLIGSRIVEKKSREDRLRALEYGRSQFGAAMMDI